MLHEGTASIGPSPLHIPVHHPIPQPPRTGIHPHSQSRRQQKRPTLNYLIHNSVQRTSPSNNNDNDSPIKPIRLPGRRHESVLEHDTQMRAVTAARSEPGPNANGSRVPGLNGVASSSIDCMCASSIPCWASQKRHGAASFVTHPPDAPADSDSTRNSSKSGTSTSP